MYTLSTLPGFVETFYRPPSLSMGAMVSYTEEELRHLKPEYPLTFRPKHMAYQCKTCLGSGSEPDFVQFGMCANCHLKRSFRVFG